MKSKSRILSLGFRSAALASKFGFFIVLAMFLEPAQVGQFGLIAVTINLSLYFLGLDFYIFANREFRVSSSEDRQYILWQSGYLYLFTHVMLLPFSWILFFYGILPWSLFFFIIALIILEHLSTELYRLLIVYGKPALASFGFFLRLGIWPVITSISMWVYPSTRTLNFVMSFWLIGVILSIVLPTILATTVPIGFKFQRLDPLWIRRGLAISLPFLIGTLCLRSIQTFDRYLIDGYLGADILGAYVFFAGLASVLPAMLQAGVYAFVSPPLITAVHNEDWPAFRLRMKELRDGIIIAVLILSFCILVGTRTMLPIIERPIYLENFIFLYLIILSNIIFSTSMYFHLALHAMRKDRVLSISHISGFFVFLASAAICSMVSYYYAVPFGIIMGNFAILLIKYWSYKIGVTAEMKYETAKR